MLLKFLNDDYMLHHAMLLSWVAYDEIMNDIYIFFEPHSCYDATDQIYDDRILIL